MRIQKYSDRQSKRFSFLFLFVFSSLLVVVFFYGKYLSDYEKLDARLYYSNIRDNSTFSLKSFTERNADILIVGDSHVYSGINFNRFAEMLKNDRIVGMAMGSAYVETFPKVIELLEKKQKIPKIILYGTSLKQFIDDKKNKSLIIRYQADIINTKSKPSLLLLSKRVIRKLQKLPPFPRSYKTDKELLSIHTIPIETLKENDITQKLSLAGNKMPGIDRWEKLIATLRFSARAEDAIIAICRFAKQHNIKLIVVDIPESPYLYSLYHDWQIKEYHKLLRNFSKCGAKVMLGAAEDYGLGNRHFVNRKMRRDYAYEKWKMPDFVPTDADIDLDHMNLIGATKFTGALIKKLDFEVTQRDGHTEK